MVEYTADKYARSPEKVFKKIYGQASGKKDYFKVYDLTKKSMILNGEPSGESQVFAKIMKNIGVDAIKINTPTIDAGLGGNQIIVFDPKKVVIVNG